MTIDNNVLCFLNEVPALATGCVESEYRADHPLAGAKLCFLPPSSSSHPTETDCTSSTDEPAKPLLASINREYSNDTRPLVIFILPIKTLIVHNSEGILTIVSTLPIQERCPTPNG